MWLIRPIPVCCVALNLELDPKIKKGYVNNQAAFEG